MIVCPQCAAQGSGGSIRRSGNMVHVITPVEPCDAQADITVDSDGMMVMHPRPVVRNNAHYGVFGWESYE